MQAARSFSDPGSSAPSGRRGRSAPGMGAPREEGAPLGGWQPHETRPPEYVACCSHNAQVPKEYAFWAWRKSDPRERIRVPYVCNSWRCEHCAPHEAAVLFRRIEQAFEAYAPEECLFGVLTLNADEHKRGKWSLKEVYQEFSRRMQKLQQRWKYFVRKLGFEDWKSRWVATIEAHKSGVPHINLVLHCPGLAHRMRLDYEHRRELGAWHREATLLRGELLRHALDCGFGPQSTLEVAKNKQALAGYIAKTAKRTNDIHRNLTEWKSPKRCAITGELVKLSQLPVQAPKNFRRVRSGKGFLPPRHKSEDWTGAVVRRWTTYEGDQQAESLVRSYQDETLGEQVQEVVQAEQRMAWAEEDQRAKLTTGYREFARAMGIPLAVGPSRVHRQQFGGKQCQAQSPKQTIPTTPTTSDTASGAESTAASAITSGLGITMPPSVHSTAPPKLCVSRKEKFRLGRLQQPSRRGRADWALPVYETILKVHRHMKPEHCIGLLAALERGLEDGSVTRSFALTEAFEAGARYQKTTTEESENGQQPEPIEKVLQRVFPSGVSDSRRGSENRFRTHREGFPPEGGGRSADRTLRLAPEPNSEASDRAGASSKRGA